MTTTGPASPRTEEQLTDQMEIIEAVSSLGLLVDQRAWDQLEALFTNPVQVDYTSLNGGEPAVVSPRDLVTSWHTLGNLDATQHLIAGHVVAVDGDHATCAANVQATHVLASHSGGPAWTVGGRYDVGLRRTGAGWRISALRLTVQWATGNQHIMTLAASRGNPD